MDELIEKYKILENNYSNLKNEMEKKTVLLNNEIIKLEDKLKKFEIIEFNTSENRKNTLKKLLHDKRRRYKIEILKESTLHDAHVFCKTEKMSGQKTGPLLEHYIRNKYGMTKNNASSCIGDLKCKGKNFEVKASLGGQENNKFNYVQIRMNHDCEYILTAYYIDDSNIEKLGELFIFQIDKKTMINLLVKYGDYAHGTISKLGKITEEQLKNNENTKEFALRPTYGSECWKTLLNFRVNEITV